MQMHTPLWASIWHAWSDLRHLAQTAGLVAASTIATAAWPPLRHASRIAQSLSPHGCTGLSAASALQLRHAVTTLPQPASGGSIPVGQLPAGGNFCALQVGCSCSAHRGSCALMDHTAVACLTGLQWSSDAGALPPGHRGLRATGEGGAQARSHCCGQATLHFCRGLARRVQAALCSGGRAGGQAGGRSGRHA
jgi:hypothetical protein